jgi:hypothetical protein
MRRLARVLAAAATLIGLVATTARAQGKTDIVTLRNGDRITGEIKRLSRGRLELKTDDVGDIAIEWDKITAVEAMRLFDVFMSDGRRLYGTLGHRVDRFVQVSGAGTDLSLAMADISGITPIGASFWAKLDGSIEAGFTYTRSSGIAQTTINSNTVYRRPAFVFRLTGSATLTQHAGEDGRDDREALEFSYVRYKGARWYVSGAARLDSNQSLGLDLRSQVGGAVGLRPVNTNRAQLEFGGGLVVNQERGVDQEPTSNVEGVLSVRYSYYRYDRPKTMFDLSTQYYPSLSNWGRQRVEMDSAVTRELWKDFIAALNVFDSFDSAPPNPDAAHNDVGVVASIGWSF